MTDEEKEERKAARNGEEDYSVLDVYMNGNRIVTMDKVIQFNCDDQNLYVSKYIREYMTPEEFTEYEKEYNTYLGYGYSAQELKNYFNWDVPDFSKPMNREKYFEISLD